MTPALFCLVLFCWPISNPDHLQSATAGATFCQVYSPIYWAGDKAGKPGDTRKTKEQIDSMNRLWVDLCKPKQKP